MHGDGTKLGISINNRPPPPARLLDISRLISRAGRVQTGVDRVEAAYLARLLNEPVTLFTLARTTLGYVLLDTDGAREIAERIAGRAAWGPRDITSWFARGKPEAVARAESDLRRFMRDRCRPAGLRAMLGRHLPRGTAYFNTGHSNLTDRVIHAVRVALDGRIVVLIHDVIPLEFPQYQRPVVSDRFGAMLRRVQDGADLVIYNSADTRTRTEAHLRQRGAVPAAVVAHLGVEVALPAPGNLADDLNLARPYFVTVGTIEPRKRHDLLLDVWDDMARDRSADTLPGLMICGARGWNNEALFARLDRLPENSPVRELTGLDDEAMAALVSGARALLFPSEAEGFGLPPIEAAALGVPVICNDLPVYRETLGDIPVYASGPDRYQWRQMIESLSKGRKRDARAVTGQAYVPPDWDSHFNTVLDLA